jgi:hypothetical protein
MLKTMMDKQHVKHAAFNLWQTLAVGSVILWLLTLNDERISRFVTGEEQVNHLRVELLDFKDGYFRQRIVPVTGEPRQADWAAGIYNGS